MSSLKKMLKKYFEEKGNSKLYLTEKLVKDFHKSKGTTCYNESATLDVETLNKAYASMKRHTVNCRCTIYPPPFAEGGIVINDQTGEINELTGEMINHSNCDWDLYAPDNTKNITNQSEYKELKND